MSSYKLMLHKIMGLALISCLFFSAVLYPRPVQGAQFVCPSSSLRVALELNLASAQFNVSEGNYDLVDYITQRVIVSGSGTGKWVVAPRGSANIQVSYNGSPIQGPVSSLLILRQKDCTKLNIFKYKNKRYRGDLLIENLNGKLHMINVINVEQYLYGVVGAEMGMGAPNEAYKAQAVVSRTYALYQKEHPQLNYDLGISTQWQVYGGYDSEALAGDRVVKAVDETGGLTIYYDNKLINAFFHANAGGYTESAENVWYLNLPYLKPVPTPEDSYALRVPQNGEWPAVSYQWEKSFTYKELRDQIAKWNREHPDERINVGEIRELAVSRQAVDPVTRGYLSSRTQSGRITQFDFIGTKGVKSFFRDGIRPVLGLRSTLFDLYLDSTVGLWNAFGSMDVLGQTKDLVAVTVDGLVTKLNGNNDKYYVVGADGVKTVPKTFTTVTIKGKGYGHGLGMSQWGAWGMAAGGDDFRSIIEHFYNGDRRDGRLQISPYQPIQKF